MSDEARTAPLFAELFEIARVLRGEAGCPWDREQTHASLVPYIIEEAHEVGEAVAEDATGALRAELGDLLFLILMMAAIAEERGAFRMDDLLIGAAEKMRRRHPHVFGDVRVEGSADVMRNWETIKRAESSARPSSLDGVPKSLSALLRARRVQEKAANLGFDWPTTDGAFAKIEEETGEIRARLAEGLDAGDEVGDLLFSVVNLSRFLQVNPEEVLRVTTEKFLRRFRRVEDAISRSDRRLTLEEMDRAWEDAKAAEE